jgi:heat-inducible transcriptional repressor
MPKRAGRKERERRILFGLVEQYLKTGKPVGSNVLQEEGFHDMSSATIRNYFASLEQEGFVKQPHSSGGRIPLGKAFHFYAEQCLEEVMKEPLQKSGFQPGKSLEMKNIVSLLQEVAAYVSDRVHASVILSAPRFDHDSIIEIQFHFLDVRRVLAVIISEFGLIHTEVLMPLEPVSPSLIAKASQFAKARIYKEKLEENLFHPDELKLVRTMYQEAVASFFVRYSSFSQEDMWKVGFSHLLEYPEFEKAHGLGATLAFFENTNLMRGLFREVHRQGTMRFWIGDSLKPYIPLAEPPCAFIAAPYCIASHCVGALGILGPKSMFYKDVFRLLRSVISQLSEVVTGMLVKHRLSYRMPESHPLVGDEVKQFSIEFREPKLLE